MAREATLEPLAWFEHKTVLIPHDDKINRGGEDAAATSDSVLVVADGVGGWANQGVNPAHFSRYFTERSHEEAQTKSPSEAMTNAAIDATEKHMGSATQVIVKVSEDGTKLQTANLGDSGYLLFHLDFNAPQSEVYPLQPYFHSVPQQQAFNFPLQAGTGGEDNLDKIFETEHEFEDGDIVLLFSDGMSDNMEPYNFSACLLENMNEAGLLTSYAKAADCISTQAYWLGKHPYYLSPFSRHARMSAEQGDPRGMADALGGKHDDITVTVAQVFKQGTSMDYLHAENDPYFEESIHLYTKSPVQGDPQAAEYMNLIRLDQSAMEFPDEVLEKMRAHQEAQKRAQMDDL